jgi:hypothetical protein
MMIGRSPVRFALNDFTLCFTLFPKALFTFRSHYFFAVGLGAPCLAFADGHLPVCTARSNCATLRRVSTMTSAMQAPKMSILNPPARSVMIYPPEWTRITGPSPSSVAASTALRLRAPMDRTVVRQTRSRLHYNSGVSESFYPRFAPRLLPCSLAVTSGITVVFLSSAD